ncbi:hypothetical protein [Methanobacterium sp.]|uniref:hypothetical protein n=1 Tax=Methanobacterium sp. TaxID=2164 RepID=UPI003C77E3F6
MSFLLVKYNQCKVSQKNIHSKAILFKYSISRGLKYNARVIIGVYVIDESDFKFNRVISPEIRYMYFMKVIQEAELRFLLASLKGETIILSGKGQLKIAKPDYI